MGNSPRTGALCIATRLERNPEPTRHLTAEGLMFYAIGEEFTEQKKQNEIERNWNRRISIISPVCLYCIVSARFPPGASLSSASIGSLLQCTFEKESRSGGGGSCQNATGGFPACATLPRRVPPKIDASRSCSQARVVRYFPICRSKTNRPTSAWRTRAYKVRRLTCGPRGPCCFDKYALLSFDRFKVTCQRVSVISFCFV